MTLSRKLQRFLDSAHVSYEVLHHPEAYTAQEIAGVQHVPGRNVMKSVILNVDGKKMMFVLPAIHLLDLSKLKNMLNANNVSLATEEEVAQLFPDFEIGAEPPLKDLAGVPIWLDSSLQTTEDIVFNAGTHTDMVRMKTDDYLTVSKPDQIGDFGKHI